METEAFFSGSQAQRKLEPQGSINGWWEHVMGLNNPVNLHRKHNNPLITSKSLLNAKKAG